MQELKSEKDKWQQEADVQAKNASEAIALQDKYEALQKEYDALKKEKQAADNSAAQVMALQHELSQLRSKISLMESEQVSAKESYEKLERDYDSLVKERNVVPAAVNNGNTEAAVTKTDSLVTTEIKDPKEEE
jgi:predicted RNase H-like nuclease (RuvC/YqgF family)